MIRILVIEAEQAAADFIIGQVRAAGIECSYERLATADELRAALRRPPDLVLCSWALPGVGGLAALDIVRAESPQLPFVFVSERPSQDGLRRASERGASAYVSSLNAEALGQMIRTLIKNVGTPLRRASDLHKSAESGAADYLLERRALLDESLHQADASAAASIKRRSPAPAPIALLVIAHDQTRERFQKLLRNANITVEVVDDADHALLSLGGQVHALLFTDQLQLVRDARCLPAGSATHILFIDVTGEIGAVEALRAGANDCLSASAQGEGFWAHFTTARRIVDLAASLQMALTDNRILSTIDELTHCGSRRFFEHQFPRELERASRLAQPLALIMCDIDHFKRINDRLGHQAGDEVLREFAGRLTGALRLSEDWVARVGGEEFAIVLSETNEADAHIVAQRLRARIGDTPFELSGASVPVTASFGVCAFDEKSHDSMGAEQLVKCADAALYESKHSGRNCVTVHSTDELEAAVSQRRRSL